MQAGQAQRRIDAAVGNAEKVFDRVVDPGVGVVQAARQLAAGLQAQAGDVAVQAAMNLVRQETAGSLDIEDGLSSRQRHRVQQRIPFQAPYLRKVTHGRRVGDRRKTLFRWRGWFAQHGIRYTLAGHLRDRSVQCGLRTAG